jgi:lactate 2-monooxygenase
LKSDLFGKRLNSPIFMCPIGLIGLCSPDFQGDVAAARASAATGVPFTLSTFSQAPMEEVIKHAGSTPNFFQLYLPTDRELAASFINRAETSGYSALLVTVDSWTLGFRPADLECGNFPQFRGFCMQNYYSDNSFTKHLAKPPHEDQAAVLAYYSTIFANPFTWEDLYCTNHGGRQANSGISTLQLLPAVVKAAGWTGSWTEPSVRTVQLGPWAARLDKVAIGEMPCPARHRSRHRRRSETVRRHLQRPVQRRGQ